MNGRATRKAARAASANVAAARTRGGAPRQPAEPQPVARPCDTSKRAPRPGRLGRRRRPRRPRRHRSWLARASMRRLRALGDAASTRVDAREALVRHSENAVKGGACLSPPRLGRYNHHVDPTRPRKRTERSIGASEKSDDDESHNVDGAALGKTLGTTDEDGLSRLQLSGGDDAQTRRKTTPRREPVDKLSSERAQRRPQITDPHAAKRLDGCLAARAFAGARAAARLGVVFLVSVSSLTRRLSSPPAPTSPSPHLARTRGRDGPVGRERRRR